MTRSKFQWFFCRCLSQSALLGFYIFLVELSRCQVFSGVKWPPYSSAMMSTLTLENQKLMELPQIHSPQTRLAVQKGDTVHLPCKIHNLGDNQVLWRHGTNVLAGSNITTYSDERVELLKDFTLRISKVTSNDEGDYECIVTSWPSLSLMHHVTIHDAPTISLLTPTNIVCTEGETVEIGCMPHGNPIPKITWSMRDGQIPLHKSLLNQPKLTLETVSRKHTGLYVCTADNGVGRPALGAVYVRVLYAPEIEIPRRRAHGGLGYKAQLVGIVHADPKPEVKWRVGSELVSTSDRIYLETYGHNEYRLVFNTVKAKDFHTYTIEANNTLGFDVKHIEFSGVPNAPILASWETEVWKNTVDDVTTDEIQVTLYWTLECYSPLINYKLFFREASIPNVNSVNEDRAPKWTELTIPADKTSDSSKSFFHTQSFTLRGLKSTTIYEAAVKARNKFGWSTLSSVCYFATFPNSSSTRTQHMDEIMSKIKIPEAEAERIKTISNLEETLSQDSGTITLSLQFYMFNTCILSVLLSFIWL